MRQRRRGQIVNVTPMGGSITVPRIALCGSNFAPEGISKALGKEVASFGVEATTSAPGQSRTDRAGLSMDRTPYPLQKNAF
jgi:NAD(P)-dependent dehydrogenase (short-subunit alcohol dehydrogenase family)